MRKTYLYVMLLVALVLAGCSKNRSADVRELLNNVPGTASFVAVVDIESLVNKTDSKVEDGAIVPGKELKALIDSEKDTDKVRKILNGDSGVEPSVSVFFADGYAIYNTGFLANTSKFEKFVSDNTGQEWKEDNGVRYNGKTAFKDNRYWTVVSGRSSIDPAVIREYLALSDKQSFAAGKFADALCKGEKDIVGWSDINAAMNLSGMGFERKAMFKMVMGTLFANADYSVFDIDFQKGKVKATAKVLDENGKETRYNFEAGKIDVSLFDTLDMDADMVMAMAVPSKLIKQLQEETSGKMSMAGMVLKSLGCVDGTVAVAAGRGESMSGVVQTTGKNTGDLMSLLGEMDLDARVDGKNIRFSKGNTDKGDEAKEYGALLRGSTLGVVTNSDAMVTKDAIDKAVVRLVPSDGSLVLDVDVYMDDEKTNSLLSLLEYASK